MPTGRPRGCPTPRVGAFTPALYEEAKSKGWTVVSMKNDWSEVFAPGIGRALR
jgi:hypothetical protein